MLEQILSSFMGSSEAGGLVQSLAAQGLSADKAQAAVAATAEGAQQAVREAGVGGLLALAADGDGPLGMLGGLLGGASTSAGMAGPMVDQIAAFVAGKVGIDPAMAKKVVGMVLPKIIDMAKGKSGAGGLLGGLLG